MTINQPRHILLVRHGQTDWNAAGRWQGVLQVPLNDIGIAQANALAVMLKSRPITAVYSSDLTRASHTARIVAEAHQLNITEDARLRELDLGAFQGLTFPEISAQFPAEVEVMKADYMGFTAPRGESRRAMQTRAYEAFQAIITGETSDGEIVIVSHGGTIRVLLTKLFGDDETIHQIHVGNTSVTWIDSDGVNHTLIKRATTDHLTVNPKTIGRDDT